MLTKRIAPFAASLGIFSLTLAGCGGSEVNGIIPIASPTPTPASAFAGTYRSANIALPSGRTGATVVTVAANGTCTGTLTVTDGATTRQATAFSFAAGTYAISGTIDPTTGAFSMTGNIGGQQFSYGGTLPTPGNGNIGGSYSLTAGGQTYSGTFAGGTTPTPNPSPTPGGGTVGTGGSQSFTFTNIDTTGLDLSPFTSANASTYQGGVIGVLTTTGGNQIVTVNAYSNLGGDTTSQKFRAVSINLTKIGGTIAAGDTFDLSSAATEAIVSYSQFDYTAGAAQVSQLFIGNSGIVTVVSRSGNNVTLRANNVRVAGNSFYNTTGSLTINGEVSATLSGN